MFSPTSKLINLERLERLADAMIGSDEYPPEEQDNASPVMLQNAAPIPYIGGAGLDPDSVNTSVKKTCAHSDYNLWSSNPNSPLEYFPNDDLTLNSACIGLEDTHEVYLDKKAGVLQYKIPNVVFSFNCAEDPHSLTAEMLEPHPSLCAEVNFIDLSQDGETLKEKVYHLCEKLKHKPYVYLHFNGHSLKYLEEMQCISDDKVLASLNLNSIADIIANLVNKLENPQVKVQVSLDGCDQGFSYCLLQWIKKGELNTDKITLDDKNNITINLYNYNPSSSYEPSFIEKLMVILKQKVKSKLIEAISIKAPFGHSMRYPPHITQQEASCLFSYLCALPGYMVTAIAKDKDGNPKYIDDVKLTDPEAQRQIKTENIRSLKLQRWPRKIKVVCKAVNSKGYSDRFAATKIEDEESLNLQPKLVTQDAELTSDEKNDPELPMLYATQLQDYLINLKGVIGQYDTVASVAKLLKEYDSDFYFAYLKLYNRKSLDQRIKAFLVDNNLNAATKQNLRPSSFRLVNDTPLTTANFKISLKAGIELVDYGAIKVSYPTKLAILEFFKYKCNLHEALGQFLSEICQSTHSWALLNHLAAIIKTNPSDLETKLTQQQFSIMQVINEDESASQNYPYFAIDIPGLHISRRFGIKVNKLSIPCACSSVGFLLDFFKDKPEYYIQLKDFLTAIQTEEIELSYLSNLVTHTVERPQLLVTELAQAETILTALKAIADAISPLHSINYQDLSVSHRIGICINGKPIEYPKAKVSGIATFFYDKAVYFPQLKTFLEQIQANAVDKSYLSTLVNYCYSDPKLLNEQLAVNGGQIEKTLNDLLKRKFKARQKSANLQINQERSRKEGWSIIEFNDKQLKLPYAQVIIVGRLLSDRLDLKEPFIEFMESLYAQQATTDALAQTKLDIQLANKASKGSKDNIKNFKYLTNLTSYLNNEEYKNKFLGLLQESGNNFSEALDKYNAASLKSNYELIYHNWFKLNSKGILLNQKFVPFNASLRPPKSLVECFNQHPEHIPWLVNKLVDKVENGSPVLAKNWPKILTAMITYAEQLRSRNKKERVKKIKNIQGIMNNIEKRFGGN
jgi:hypothetical protein